MAGDCRKNSSSKNYVIELVTDDTFPSSEFTRPGETKGPFYHSTIVPRPRDLASMPLRWTALNRNIKALRMLTNAGVLICRQPLVCAEQSY